VFIELPDGSARDIDRGSVTLAGVPALPKPNALGDADGNGIPDLMVKFNRGALLTTDGHLHVTGSTRDGGCFSGATTVDVHWCPVQRSNYFIEFTTSNMPDPQLDGLQARLDVRRVRPVGGCPTAAALVLEDGISIPAAAAFDLQYQDYSLMERLAMRGIDTFAADRLGFGLSSLPSGSNPLEDACNASLPQCKVCPRQPGDLCDCRPSTGINAAFYKSDQQGSDGSGRYLHPNPLPTPCAHTSSTHFQTVADEVAQLGLVVEDALERSGVPRVHLLGSAVGGSIIGKYLGDDPAHENKVEGAIFLTSSFGSGPARAIGTWPLAVMDRADAIQYFEGCPGSLDPKDLDGNGQPDVADALWDTIKAHDPIGAAWGPQSGGLSRYPVVTRFDWNATVASRIHVPALLMVGQKATAVNPQSSTDIWANSPLQVPDTVCASDGDCLEGYACRSVSAGTPARCRLGNRLLEPLACASTAMLWETCSGDGCVDPHRRVQQRVGDWILTGK
jgi:alpha-beta hydrolase superfamily lysophospholipase